MSKSEAIILTFIILLLIVVGAVAHSFGFFEWLIYE